MSAALRVGPETAARITQAMESAGLQRQTLATRAGIARETMARKLERQPDTFTIRELCEIADVLGLSFEELVGLPVAA